MRVGSLGVFYPHFKINLKYNYSLTKKQGGLFFYLKYHMDQVVIYFISCKQLYSKQPFKNQRHPYHNSFRRADFSKLDILRRSKITSI